MKKISVEKNIFIIAKKSKTPYKLDYYLQFPDKVEEYMFTRNYSAKCYEACKSGVPLNNMIFAKRKNPAVVKLVKYLQFMMPYFIDYYELRVGDGKNEKIKQ